MRAKTFPRHLSHALRLAIFLGVACTALTCWSSGAGAVNASGPGIAAGNGQTEIVVRLIPFELTRYDSWQLQNHNGKDVLEMVRQLKPDVLNRFFTPRPTMTAMVPMGPGSPPMPIAQYLTQVMTVCGDKCTMTAKVPLNRNALWTDQYLKDSLAAALALPVTPPVRAMDLDNWFNRPGNYPAEMKDIKNMGWDQLGLNYTGSGEQDIESYGLVSYGLAAIHPGDWQVATKQIERMKTQGVKNIQAAIDYPRAIAAFGKITPDQQADVIETVSKEQKTLGFKFVYPIIYGGYDATTYVTNKDGPYHGKTVFDVILECIARDRLEGN